MLITEMIEKLQELKEKYGDIPVFCEESQDNYYEYKEVNTFNFSDGSDYDEKGVYLKYVD